MRSVLRTRSVSLAAVLAGLLVSVAAAQAAPPTYNWAGPYIGVQGGIADPLFSTTGNLDLGIFGKYSASQSYGNGSQAADVGVFGGYNFQTSQGLVFGGLADFNWSQMSATSDPLFAIGRSCSGRFYVCAGQTTTKVDWYGTVRGTVGQAIGQLLLYGTGGFAYGQVESTVAGTSSFGPLFNVSSSDIRYGWTAGAGAALAINKSLSVRMEYDHVDLGSGTVASISHPVKASIVDTAAFDTVTVGLAVRFP